MSPEVYQITTVAWSALHINTHVKNFEVSVILLAEPSDNPTSRL